MADPRHPAALPPEPIVSEPQELDTDTHVLHTADRDGFADRPQEKDRPASPPTRPGS